MPFHFATGFVTVKTPAVLSATAIAARVDPAPVMPQATSRPGYDLLLGSISSGISAKATELHRLDLERSNDQTHVAHRQQDLITDIKDKVARKVALKARLASVDGSVELLYKAS